MGALRLAAFTQHTVPKVTRAVAGVSTAPLLMTEYYFVVWIQHGSHSVYPAHHGWTLGHLFPLCGNCEQPVLPSDRTTTLE